MKIFLSWSGERSKKMAEGLRSWLKSFEQRFEPWMSKHDIPGGTFSQEEIRGGLEGAKYCIVCATLQSVRADWVQVETGALRWGRNVSVTPYMLDIEPGSVPGPIGLLQARRANEEETLQLLQEINALLDVPRDGAELRDAFNLQWEKLNQLLGAARAVTLPSENASRAPKGEWENELRDELERSVFSGADTAHAGNVAAYFGMDGITGRRLIEDLMSWKILRRPMPLRLGEEEWKKDLVWLERRPGSQLGKLLGERAAAAAKRRT